MEPVRLVGTQIQTSPIGFGCVGLTTFGDTRDALRMLELAFDLGIRHFDVARAYGAGWAESILGQFLRPKRLQLTVTSKFGLMPPAVTEFVGRSGVTRAKRLLKLVPAIDSLVRSRMRTASRAYGPEACAASLAESKRQLGIETIDIYLLHEPTLSDASDAGTINYLEQRLAAGEIRAFGVGSSSAQLGPDMVAWPDAYRVVQTESVASRNSLDRIAGLRDRALITHGVLTEIGPLSERARLHPELVTAASAEIGADMADPAVLAAWTMAFARSVNPAGVHLIRTMSEGHLRANMRHASFAPPPEALASFRRLCAALLGAGP